MEKEVRRRKHGEGIWTIDLPEVSVTARKPRPKSVFRASYVMEEEQIQSMPKNRGMNSLLFVIPHVDLLRGVAGSGNVLYNNTIFSKLIIDDQVNPPLIFEQNIHFKGGYNQLIYNVLQSIDPDKVTQIYISETFAGIKISKFSTADVGVSIPVTDLVLVCRNVNDILYEPKKYHIKTVQPLGCQQPAAFYAPKYGTPEAKTSATPDYRTTIHWQPDVSADSLGIAAFDFYTADTESSYTMVIEGVTADGKIIHQERKLWKREDE
jgi:hypothetical protein